MAQHTEQVVLHQRRTFLSTLLAGTASAWLPAFALRPEDSLYDGPRLDVEQSRRFRAWVMRIVRAQFELGPTPRWQQRDCAGLVRFAVAETLRDHDAAWRRANGLSGKALRTLPAELDLKPEQRALRHSWRLVDGSRSAYAGALELIQGNSVLVARDLGAAQPADLLFFDQGDDQHLMVWMGNHIAYHTGTESSGDSGLRAVTVKELLNWKDTRWQPTANNPNFIGVFRFAFLAR